MKKLILLVVLGVLLFGGAMYWRSRRAATAAAVPATTIAKVTRGSLFQAVSSTGRVVSNLDVDIKCKASGEVIKLPFDVSDFVHKGELLVELDPIDEQRAVAQAEAALAASQAKLVQSQRNVTIAQQTLETSRLQTDAALKSAQAKAEDATSKFERRKELVAQKLISQEDFLTAQTAAAQAQADLQNAKAQVEALKTQELALELKRQDVKLAESQVKSDQIALSNAQQRLTDTKVSAPMDGVVSGRNVQIGTIISSGITNVGGGTTVLTLSDLSHIFVLAAVDESDIGNVALDQSVLVTADAFAGRKFHGKVVRVATKGVNVSNVVTFEVKIEVIGDDKTMLKPEMTANVQIITAQRNDVLVVPTRAVTSKDGKMIASVIRDDGTKEQREVKAGLGDGQKLEIAQGLNEGDTVEFQAGESQSKWRADAPRPGANMMSPLGGTPPRRR